MERLRQSDVRKLISALNGLYSETNPSSLPERLLSAFKAVISSDIVAFDIFNSAGVHQGILPYDPFDAISSEELQIFAEYVIEHPFFAEIFLDKRFEALKISDFLPTQKFHNTGIYNEFYRHIGVDRQIAVVLPVSSEQIITCAFSRSGKDFTQDDRLLLNLLATHLTQAVRNAQSFERLQSITELQINGLIALDAPGAVQYANQAAQRFLKEYFPTENHSSAALPESLNNWLKTQKPNGDINLPPMFSIENGNGRLSVHSAYNSLTNEQTLLLEEKLNLSPEKLKTLGLTDREAGILFWISQGKTDDVIAHLYSISPRTVQKHTEHIFTKLGVETRTAAMLRALEIL